MHTASRRHRKLGPALGSGAVIRRPPVRPSARPSVRLTVCLSSIYRPPYSSRFIVRPSTRPSIRPFVRPSVFTAQSEEQERLTGWPWCTDIATSGNGAAKSGAVGKVNGGCMSSMDGLTVVHAGSIPTTRVFVNLMLMTWEWLPLRMTQSCFKDGVPCRCRVLFDEFVYACTNSSVYEMISRVFMS